MNFLFWNLNKNKETFPHLVKIVNEEEIDVIALAEFPTDENSISELMTYLNETFTYLTPLDIKSEKVKIFYKPYRIELINKYDGNNINVKTFTSTATEISLIFCHLGSKINNNEHQQYSMSIDLKEEIERYEEMYKNENTIICGDFNMNPFEIGMVDSKALHAVMDKNIAKKRCRTVNGKDYKFFYNPMWGCLGDNGKGNYPGTHYYSHSDSMQYFWNMYDQILIRPSVIEYFNDDKLKIITKGQSYNLLNDKGKINDKISDHLPIMFNLNI